MNQSRRYTFQKDHEGVPTCGAAHLAEWTEAELIDALVKELIEARRMAMQALVVYAERVELKSGRTGALDIKDTVERLRDFVTATEASAIGDNVKVPPHWHVKLSVHAGTVPTGPDSVPRVMEGEMLHITHGGDAYQFPITGLIGRAGGAFVFDIVLPFRPNERTEIRLSKRSGLDSIVSILSVY